jgi:hypothetical protein
MGGQRTVVRGNSKVQIAYDNLYTNIAPPPGLLRQQVSSIVSNAVLHSNFTIDRDSTNHTYHLILVSGRRVMFRGIEQAKCGWLNIQQAGGVTAANPDCLGGVLHAGQGAEARAPQGWGQIEAALLTGGLAPRFTDGRQGGKHGGQGEEVAEAFMQLGGAAAQPVQGQGGQVAALVEELSKAGAIIEGLSPELLRQFRAALQQEYGESPSALQALARALGRLQGLAAGESEVEGDSYPITTPLSSNAGPTSRAQPETPEGAAHAQSEYDASRNSSMGSEAEGEGDMSTIHRNRRAEGEAGGVGGLMGRLLETTKGDISEDLSVGREGAVGGGTLLPNQARREDITLASEEPPPAFDSETFGDDGADDLFDIFGVKSEPS